MNEGWQFSPDPGASYTAADVDRDAKWRPDRPGQSWNAQFDDLRDYAGAGWYRVRVALPLSAPRTKQLLHFGAVDYLTDVWVNGRHVGQHEGGYTPFTFDISKAVRVGSNEILIKVFDPPMRRDTAGQNQAEGQATGKDTGSSSRVTTLESKYRYDEIPHGKQNWYVQTSGIWQPVRIETVPARYVEWVHVTPHNTGDVSVEARLAGTGPAAPLTLTLIDPFGAEIGKLTLTEHGDLASGTTHIAGPRLWDTEHPNLYSAALRNGSQVVRTRFGFREFTEKEGRLFLNGQPFYMRAALDQDFYPQGIYTPPSGDFERQEMLKSKAMGLNLLRCHIKVPDPRYLDAADETGMLVWYEIPVWNDVYHWTPQAAQRGVDTFHAEVERDWNHPSIVIQSIMNEQWGMDFAQADQRAWLKQTFSSLKQLTAPLGRLITDDSACCKGFHLQSDFADWHEYDSIPDHAENWSKWVKEYAGRPKWLFSSFGDAAPTGHEPLIVSEFGNWGLPELPAQADLPWWFPRDFGGREITRPAGVFDRLHNYGFDRLFPDFNALAKATEQHEYVALQYEIERMRQEKTIQGYVITELTDANWEANGLMSMWRQPKVFADALDHIQQDDVVMGKFATHNFTPGEEVTVPLMLSHYSDEDLTGASIFWQSSDGQSGSLPLQDMPESGAVSDEGAIRYKAAEVASPTAEFLRLQVVNRRGRTLAQNRYRFAVYPKADRRRQLSVTIHDPGNQLTRLKASLADRGVQISGGEDKNAVWVTSVMDEATSTRAASGGKVVVLANSKDAIPAGNRLSIVPRAGSDLSGDWVSNFNWALTTDPVWRRLAPVIDQSILGWEAAAVTPDFVINGLGEQDAHAVLAGVFYGWLNWNRAYLARIPGGNSGSLVTTFRFDRYGKDPFATELFDSIVEAARGTPSDASGSH